MPLLKQTALRNVNSLVFFHANFRNAGEKSISVKIRLFFYGGVGHPIIIFIRVNPPDPLNPRSIICYPMPFSYFPLNSMIASLKAWAILWRLLLIRRNFSS
jgi:hypothetical protein